MPLAIERVRQLLGARLEELAGAQASVRIPLTNRVINALMADYLASADVPVASAEVQARDDGELLVRVRLRKPAFAPAIVASLRIEQQPVFPSPAVLGLRWSLPGLGLVTPFVGPALSLFKSGPPWLVIDGSRILLDVARALRERAPAEIAGAITALEITTREGAVLVRVGLRVRGTAELATRVTEP